MNSKFSIFKNMINNPSLEFVMEAHSALSAKIVEEVGFKAIWASSLTISAQCGLRDCNELSWSQVLDIVEFMSDATSIPIILDGDSGYGDYNNVRLLVKKMCQRNIASLCIEDKIFPKNNSFTYRKQELTSIKEFQSKIKAGKDVQDNKDFTIIARTESLIAGKTISEALERAYSYIDAGADAILIHSRKETASEITAFAKKWQNYAPLVIIPTKYHNTPTQQFRDMNISLVIWANHSLRASINAMKKVCQKIFLEESLSQIEKKISSIEEIFDLTKQLELDEQDKFFRN